MIYLSLGVLVFGAMIVDAQARICNAVYQQCHVNNECCSRICNGVYKRCVPKPVGHVPSIQIYEDNYLIWHQERLSWSAAKAFCEERGFHLLSLEKKRKFKTLSAYLHNEGFLVNGKYPPSYWTSGNSINTPGEYVWEQSEKPVYSGLWEKPPRHTNRRKCVIYNFKEPGSVCNADCSNKHYFICEKPTRKVTPSRGGIVDQGPNDSSSEENEDDNEAEMQGQSDVATKPNAQSQPKQNEPQIDADKTFPTYNSFGFAQDDNGDGEWPHTDSASAESLPKDGAKGQQELAKSSGQENLKEATGQNVDASEVPAKAEENEMALPAPLDADVDKPQPQQLDPTRPVGGASHEHHDESGENDVEHHSGGKKCTNPNCPLHANAPAIQDNKQLSIKNVSNVQISNVNSINKVDGTVIRNIGNTQTSKVQNILSNTLSKHNSFVYNMHNDTGGLKLLNLPQFDYKHTVLDKSSQKFLQGLCGGFPCPPHVVYD